MYKVDLIAPSVIIDEVQVQEGNAQDETQGQQLTDEDIKEIKEKVDEKEEVDVILELLKKTIDIILIEEFFVANRKMNLFRRVLAGGILKFAEKHAGDKPNLTRLVDSFRAAWKVFKEGGDDETTMDVFMKEMKNELWIPSNAEEDTDVFGV